MTICVTLSLLLIHWHFLYFTSLYSLGCNLCISHSSFIFSLSPCPAFTQKGLRGKRGPPGERGEKGDQVCNCIFSFFFFHFLFLFGFSFSIALSFFASFFLLHFDPWLLWQCHPSYFFFPYCTCILDALDNCD